MFKKVLFLFPLFFFTCFVCIFSVELAYAQVSTPRLVTDLNKLTSDSDTYNTVAVGNRLFFTADDGIHGDELWVSDGTEAGTKLVKDITPGPESSRLLGYNGQGLGDGNILYFTRAIITEPETEVELWRSDGTETGTYLIKKFATEMSSLVLSGGQLYFTIVKYVDPNETDYVQLWKSDGTEAGTVLVKDFGLNNYGRITDLFVNGDKILFLGNRNREEGGGTAVWTSDGTAAGTQPFQFINEGEFGYLFWSPKQSESGAIFFGWSHRLADGSWERSLWRTDGTAAGTEMTQIIDIPDGYQWGRAQVIGEDIYYAFVDDWDRPANGQIWRSSGSPATTTKIADACLGEITDVGPNILMTAASNCTKFGVWKTDGSAEGTVLLREFAEVVHFITWYYNTLIEFNGHGYFVASDGNGTSDGFELWRSDGTVDGTAMVRDINQSSYDDKEYRPRNLTPVGDKLFFSTFDADVGDELWTTDGTIAGTQLVRDIRTDGTASGNIKNLTVLNDKICFTGETQRYGSQLWCTDGTEGGTKSFDSLCQGGARNVAIWLTPFSGKLYAEGGSGPDCRRNVVIFDGTDAGTMYVPESSVVKEYYPNGFYPYGEMITTESHLYYTDLNFDADLSPNYELWRFDRGSSVPIQIETEAPHIGRWTAIDNILYYAVQRNFSDFNSPTKIWRSDGTSEGTYSIHELESEISLLTGFRGDLFFGSGSKIWKSDGTVTSPILVKDISPDSFQGTGQTVATETAFYFLSRDDSSSFQRTVHSLWSSDGTGASTVEIELTELADSAWMGDLFSTPEFAYIHTYSYPESNSGPVIDLWASGGTTDTTKKITSTDLPVGIGRPLSFYSTNEHLYFYSVMANEGDDDEVLALLRTDGTEVGTEVIVEFPEETVAQTGSNERFAYSMALHEKEDSGAETDRLYFTANLANKGIELWSIDLEDRSSVVVVGDVNCDGVVSAIDALFIGQYAMNARTDSGGCPLTDDNSMHASVGDVNGDQAINLADAVFVLECSVGISNAFCPVVNSVAGMGPEETTAVIEARQLLVEAGVWSKQDINLFVPLILQTQR